MSLFTIFTGFRWCHEAILLLLEEYRQREQDMYSGRISHKKAWEQIALVLNNKGYMVTARQCTTRVNTMKRTYKTVRDHNKKSGNYKRTWKYIVVSVYMMHKCILELYFLFRYKLITHCVNCLVDGESSRRKTLYNAIVNYFFHCRNSSKSKYKL